MDEFFPLTLVSKQVLLASLLIVGYMVLRRIGQRWITRLAGNKRVSLERTKFVTKTFNFMAFILFVSFFTIILDLGFGDISLFLSSIFAVLGVALFAQWSILSNLTASILIFFVFPYRIGDTVKVAEKDEDISGVIIDITMFHVILRHANGNIITYPNSLILQKGVTKIVVKNLPDSPAEE